MSRFFSNILNKFSKAQYNDADARVSENHGINFMWPNTSRPMHCNAGPTITKIYLFNDIGFMD